jgi:acetyltransferase-like isoleucine patch superfamily enzyme
MKSFFKIVFDGLFSLLVLPCYGLHWLWAVFGAEERSFWGFSQFFSLFPGLFGNYLRKNFYRLAMTRCGRECAICFGTIFSQPDTEVGEGVYIGPGCNIGKSRISDHCTFGSGVHILSGKAQHHFDDLETPIQEQGGVFEKIHIGEDSWIGNGAIVLANIGRKCIIGAGSVVIRDIPDFAIVAGNPAKVIRMRKEEKGP